MDKKVDTSLICNGCGYTANKPDELEEHKKNCPNNPKSFRSRGSGGQSLGSLTGKYNKI